MKTPMLCVAIAALNFLCSGAALGQIRIGQTSALTGPASAAVNEINIGAKMYLNAVNAEGGIGGQQIEMVSLDDNNKAPAAAENATQLINDQRVVALFLSRGTPQTQAMLPQLAQGKIVLIAPSTGAMALHQPVNPWVFNVRASYQREAEAVVRHLGLTGLDKLVLLYVNDSFGEDAIQGAMKVFKEANVKPAMMQSVDREKPNYAALIPKLTELKPLGVLIIGSPTSVTAGIHAMRAAGLKATVATLSNNAAGGFITGLGPDAGSVIVSQVFPSERRLAVPMIAEASRLAAAQKVTHLTPAMIEGYAAAKVLVAGLRRAEKESKVVTRGSLKRALESLDRFDIGGLEISYSATDHTGLDFADLSMIGPDGTFRR
ncbi:MAG TPA: ABC transporter substrate-binding protein [Burkholderiaceae bacterium]|nr:ABC transporter substrate-binding protein [Burkholderiaceae bacterium]